MARPPGDARPRTDAELVELWLRDRHPRWRDADRANVERFLAFVGRPLREVTFRDVERFGDSLAELSPVPRARAGVAVARLIRFGRSVGYLPARHHRRRPGPA